MDWSEVEDDGPTSLLPVPWVLLSLPLPGALTWEHRCSNISGVSCPAVSIQVASILQVPFLLK